jgi:hypothetical protein
VSDFIKVNPDGWTFSRRKSGTPFVPFGTNYYDPMAGWPPHIWKNFEADTTRSNFERMRSLGVNIIRFHLAYPSFYDQRGQLNQRGIEKLTQLLQICGEFDIAALITGLVYYEGLPKWSTNDYFVDDEVRDNLCVFWRALASPLKGEETVFGYDIYNEPSIPWQSRLLEEKWRLYLRNKYGKARALNEAGAASAAVSELNQISIPMPHWNAQPSLVFEFRMFQERLAFSWLQAQTEAIRDADSNHLVTIGINPWTFPDLKFVDVGYGKCRGFNTHFVAPLVDFMSVHYYPISFFFAGDYPDPVSSEAGRRLAIDLCEGQCRLSYENKPVILEEFGWYGGGAPGWAGHVERLPFKSQGEHASYCKALVEASREWCSGWIQWAYGDTPQSPDISQFGGLVDRDGEPKAWAREFSALAQMIQGTVPSRKMGVGRKQVDLFNLYTSETAENTFWREYLAQKQVDGSVDFDFPDQFRFPEYPNPLAMPQRGKS